MRVVLKCSFFSPTQVNDAWMVLGVGISYDGAVPTVVVDGEVALKIWEPYQCNQLIRPLQFAAQNHSSITAMAPGYR